MSIRPTATARPVFELVSQRIGVDTDVLMHLFGECLEEMIKQVETTGACTVRGHGKFTHVQRQELCQTSTAGSIGKNVKVRTRTPSTPSPERITVFERSKYVPTNRPFKALQLKKRLSKGV